MECDRPTSMVGQFKNAEIGAIAQSLDQRLLGLLKKASLKDSMARGPARAPPQLPNDRSQP